MRGGAWGPGWPLGEALRFLTLLPVPGLPAMGVDRIGRAVAWFPLVGLVVGAIGLAFGALAGAIWNDGVQALVVVVTWMLVTGGLHLDGLADTFDGMLSWRSREQRLEIMRDSRIGTMGALAVFAVLAGKLVLIAGAGEGWVAAVLVAPVLGRWADVVAILAFPPAREGGLGRTFRESSGRGTAAIAGVTALAVTTVLSGAVGIVAMIVVTGITLALGRWWVRALGGLTGDTYGAASEIGELVALAALTAAIARVVAP